MQGQTAGEDLSRIAEPACWDWSSDTMANPTRFRRFLNLALKAWFETQSKRRFDVGDKERSN